MDLRPQSLDITVTRNSSKTFKITWPTSRVGRSYVYRLYLQTPVDIPAIVDGADVVITLLEEHVNTIGYYCRSGLIETTGGVDNQIIPGSVTVSDLGLVGTPGDAVSLVDETGVAVTISVTGDPGAAGPQGSQGAQGWAGLQGSAGGPGPQGPAGPAGDKGPIGQIGPQGIQGAVGPQGIIGPQGNIGPQGDVGPQGVVGPQGIVGPQGAIGPQGEIGPAGPQGPAVDDTSLVHKIGSETITGIKTFQPSAINVVAMIVKGLAGQTADLEQWQDSASAPLVKITADGSLRVTHQNLWIARSDQGTLATATLFARLSYSSAGMVSVVTQAGAILPWAISTLAANASSQNTIVAGTANAWTISTLNAIYIPLVVGGAAAATADLTQWNKGGGAPVAKILPDGAFESTGPGAGIILRSPNNTRWRVTVSDNGLLTTAAA